MRHSRNLCIGPGGKNCVCCFPAKGKARKLEYRRAKRRDEKQAFKAEELGYNQLIERPPVNFDKFEG